MPNSSYNDMKLACDGGNGKTSYYYLRTIPFILALLCASLPLTLGFLDRGQSFVAATEVDKNTLNRNYFVLIGWISAYLLALMVWFKSPRTSSLALRRSISIIIFMCLATFSFFWSEFPLRTLTTAFSFGGILLISSVAAPTFAAAPGLLVRQVAVVLGITQFINLLFVFAFPKWGIAPDGRWTGWLGNPNALGVEAFCCFWANYACTMFCNKKQRKWIFMFIIIALVNLFGSNSVTSIIASLIVSLILISFKFVTSRTSWILWSLYAIVFFTIIGLLVENETIMSIFGRSSTLTGRTTAWVLALNMFYSQPWFGYGFGDTRHFIFSSEISSTNFHNSYIEILVRLGVVGLTIFCFFLLRLHISTISKIKSSLAARCYLGIFIGFLITGFSESVVIAVRNPLFLIFWTCSMAIFLGNRVKKGIF